MVVILCCQQKITTNVQASNPWLEKSGGVTLRKIKAMSTSSSENESTRMDWILFVLSTTVMILMLIFINEWFWLALPFSLTYLVKALRVM